MFRTTRYASSIIMAAVAVISACSRPACPETPGAAEEEEAASLTIDISTSQLGIDVQTRTYAYADDLDPATSPKTSEAAFIDGSQMRCLIVLLIHKKSNRIVAVREIFPDPPASNGNNVPHNLDRNNGFLNEKGEVDYTLTSASRARVTFDYDNPMHEKNGESAERLVRGEYRLFAIANYNHEVVTNNNSNLQLTLDDIVKLFHDNPDVGIGNFNPTYEFFYNIRFLLNRTIIHNEDGTFKEIVKDPVKSFIRPAVNQTLSATQNVFLTAGDNQIAVKLLRISSRTRVEVKNYAQTKLKVHNLAFSDNYTQSTNFLFRREYHEGNYDEIEAFNDDDDKGAPVVWDERAIVSFTKEETNENGVVTGGGVEVPTGEKKCIFDAMMYESYDETKPFTYTIDVSYPEVTDYKTRNRDELDKDKEITEGKEEEYAYAIDGTTKYLSGFTDAEKLYDAIIKDHPSCYFLIQSAGPSRKFICEKEDNKLCVDKTELELVASDIDSYLWSLEAATQDDKITCTLKNVKTGRFMNAVSSGNYGMTSDESQHSYVMGVSNGNVTFSSNSKINDVNTTCYLNVQGGTGPELGGWNGLDSNSEFRLYPIKTVEVPVYYGSPRIRKTIPLAVFNDETAVVEELHEIRRNDLVRILIEVSYNPDKGDFEFKVKSWIPKEGEVTFN